MNRGSVRTSVGESACGGMANLPLEEAYGGYTIVVYEIHPH
jgi:hypothetical protein